MIDIELIKKSNLEDGDVLVITMPGPVSIKRIDIIREKIENIIDNDNVKVLVLPDGAKVEIIKPVSEE